MKKTLLLLSVILSTYLNAQPVLQSNSVQTDLSFEVYQIVSPGTSNPSLSGAGITWDFTSASVQLMGTATILSPSASVYGSIYPDANVAYNISIPSLSINEWVMLKTDANKIEELASGLGSSSPTHYTNPRTLVAFPLSYQQTFSDDFQKQGQSLTSVSKVYESYGTILSQLGTFNDVVKLVENDGDIMFVNSNPFHPILEIAGSSVTFWKRVQLNSINENLTQKIQIFPNPAQNQITVSGLSNETEILIFSSTGKLMQSIKTNNETTQNIDIQNLANGVYFIQTNNSQTIKNQLFIKN